MENIAEILEELSKKIPDMSKQMRKNAAELGPEEASHQNLLLLKSIYGIGDFLS